MNRPLTTQQQAVYDFIRDKILSRGYGPTVREIGEHMSIKSPNGVMCHLKALERKGMLTRAANKSRAIELTESVSRLGTLPVAGRIASEKFFPSPQATESFNLANLTAGRSCYLVRVRDDSLRAAAIVSDDLLVIQRQGSIKSGQLVLVRTADEGTLVRLAVIENGRTRLQPVSPDSVIHAFELLEPVEVQGIVAGVLRLPVE